MQFMVKICSSFEMSEHGDEVFQSDSRHSRPSPALSQDTPSQPSQPKQDLVDTFDLFKLHDLKKHMFDLKGKHEHVFLSILN
jgi:hypothetical protein